MAAVTAREQPLPALPERSLAAAFLRCCALDGDRGAVTHDGRTLSYRELAGAAVAVARRLEALHLPAHSLVAICASRSVEMIAAMLGTVLAGHAYLPLDPAYPEARLHATLEDARPAALLADTAQATAVAGPELPCLLLETAFLTAEVDLKDLPPAKDANPDALAYVIYTSGSTGRPKGVMVSHNNVLRLFRSTADWFQFTPDDVWTMFHSSAFDFSVWEMWGALLTGGRLVLVSFEQSRDPSQFRALLSRECVTVLNQTPTAFRLLDEADRSESDRSGDSTAGALSLRVIVFGGEALHFRSLRPWIGRHGDSMPQLVNMYGITETTVHTTYRRILRHDAEHETASLLGEPLPDLRLHLLDGTLQPVPPGTAGEIYIEGPGVALGYLHQPDQTASRFLENPLAPLPRPRLYRSGDLALRRADGELVYLGRADRQVKVNGFRIELAEVETALSGCPGIQQVAVAVQPGDDALPRLLAVFTAVPGEATDADSLAQFATRILPAHMRPSLYYPVDRLPLTLNGKLDLTALKQPKAPASQHRPSTNRAAAMTSLEAAIAQAWRSTLGREEISPTQNFFDAGGTSVQLVALRLDLERRLDRAIPITWLFQHSTIASLAERLQQPTAEQTSASKTAPLHQTQSRQNWNARTAWMAAQAQRREAR